MIKKFVAIILFLSLDAICSKCHILVSQQKTAETQHDGLFEILVQANSCPQNNMALDLLMMAANKEIHSYMVANEGKLNPAQGSFSFFERYSNDSDELEVFIGHFTELDNGQIVLAQTPIEKRLLIEAIAWDPQKKLYNFYELIGTGTGGQWFYRGDSLDALKDNKNLYLNAKSGEPQFGNRMRCSACHNSGGPIMKEISAPHNDWWEKEHPLTFGSHSLSFEVATKVSNLKNAQDFAQQVKTGVEKLFASPSYQDYQSLQSMPERLRPLFCTDEINLNSSLSRLHDEDLTFSLPSGFVVHPIFNPPDFFYGKNDYLELLNRNNLWFSHTLERDADHMWLTPTVSFAQEQTINSLMNNNIFSEKEIKDILMVDFKHPVFSFERCELLKEVPTHYNENWKNRFFDNLEHSLLPQAQTLLENLKNPLSFEETHIISLEEYFETLGNPESIELLFIELLTNREKAFSENLAQNPLGQILEPGFRIIFPEFKN